MKIYRYLKIFPPPDKTKFSDGNLTGHSHHLYGETVVRLVDAAAFCLPVVRLRRMTGAPNVANKLNMKGLVYWRLQAIKASSSGFFAGAASSDFLLSSKTEAERANLPMLLNNQSHPQALQNFGS